MKPYSFNGVYQPSILETFAQGNVLLLSCFNDRVLPFLSASTTLTPNDLTVSTFTSLAQTVCRGPTACENALWGNEE